MIHQYPHFDLTRHNTFRMRVSCALYLELTEEEDLQQLDWSTLPQSVFVMGGGSNLLFTKDFPGTIVHMANQGIRWNGDGTATVAAGVVFDRFCRAAAEKGLWGPENLSLIPGDTGAAAVQNIGAYGVEAKDIIASIRAYERETGRFVRIDPADCGYGYRKSHFKKEWKGRFILTSVTFRLSAEPQPRLDYGGLRDELGERAGRPTPQEVREAIIRIRRRKLPDPEELGSAGSFFCNPVVSREQFEKVVAIARKERGEEVQVPHYETPDGVKIPAAWLIDQCGFKGLEHGGAKVYPKQPLVIVNASGEARPEDILGLQQQIIDTIAGKYGIRIFPECEFV